MKIKVRQGIIHVNSVSMIQNTDEVICVSIDTKQKYPEYCGGGASSEGEQSIYLGASERTLRIEDPDAGLTEIEINDLGDSGFEWIGLAESGRYNVYFVLVRRNDNHEEEWGELDWWDTKEQDDEQRESD